MARLSLTERLVRARRITDLGCWEWQGSVTNCGYGQIFVSGRMRTVHRVSFEMFIGPIADGVEIDHLCSNRRCFQPDHMELVSHAENMRLRSDRQTHCKWGHEFTPENTRLRNRSKRGGGRGFERVCRACARRRYHEAAEASA